MNIRPFLIMGIVALAILTLLGLYVKMTEPVPQSNIIQKVERTQQAEIPKVEVPSLVLQVNSRNSEIRSLYCNGLQIKIWQKGVRFRLKGDLSLEKTQNFRIIVSSVFGEELDLGANDSVFWYWSRRDKDPGLHYAKHEDFHKTRLKTPFNPIFMRDSLGISEIDLKDARFVESENDLIILRQRRNSVGKMVLVSTFIGKASERIEGIIVTDMDGSPLASAEIKEVDRMGLPLKVLYMWHEEEQALLMEFNNSKTNSAIDDKMWQMPNKNPRLDMAEDILGS